MNRLQIIALAALLTGCASAPQPKSEQDEGARVESAAHVDTQLRQGTHTIDTSIQAPEVAVEPRVRKAVDAKSRQCLAQAMYWEARGEGQDGMIAVASVILNRVEDERFPDTVCGVIYEGGESPPCQFSWWCDGKSDKPTNQTKWAETVTLANEFLALRPQDPTDKALFYHANWIENPWSRQLTARIGNHIFYR